MLKMKKTSNLNSQPTIKALVLLSGGLDSILAAKVLLNMGIQIEGLTFASPFWSSESAIKAAKTLGINLIVLDFEKEYLEILKNPKYGYGKGFNPCIDCHALMIKKAWEYGQKNNFNFIASGEVLGERPMSQNRNALNIVAQISGVDGYLLRPLSAKLLAPTIPEIKGWVAREKLLDIKGRSRKKQIELAAQWGIKDYPTPSGGCLLTDPGYASRIKNLFTRWPDFNFQDAEIIKNGRIFWNDNNLIIVGRNQEENLKIKNLAQKDDVVLKIKDYPGPTTLVRLKNSSLAKETFKMAAQLTLKYAHLNFGEIIFIKDNQIIDSFKF